MNAAIRNARREAAEERQREADVRSPSAQLDRLDQRFGRGFGAERERAKLWKRIHAIRGTSEASPSTEGKAIVTVRGSGHVPAANQDRRRNGKPRRGTAEK